MLLQLFLRGARHTHEAASNSTYTVLVTRISGSSGDTAGLPGMILRIRPPNSARRYTRAFSSGLSLLARNQLLKRAQADRARDLSLSVRSRSELERRYNGPTVPVPKSGDIALKVPQRLKWTPKARPAVPKGSSGVSTTTTSITPSTKPTASRLPNIETTVKTTTTKKQFLTYSAGVVAAKNKAGNVVPVANPQSSKAELTPASNGKRDAVAIQLTASAVAGPSSSEETEEAGIGRSEGTGTSRHFAGSELSLDLKTKEIDREVSFSAGADALKRLRGNHLRTLSSAKSRTVKLHSNRFLRVLSMRKMFRSRVSSVGERYHI